MTTHDASHALRAASLCAAAMIAGQVAGKATRDALYLSFFPVTSLPLMYVVSSLVCILAAVAASRTVSRIGPARALGLAFGASAFLFVAEWGAFRWAPRVSVVALYLHLAVFGLFTVSSFWSLLNEKFDPRAAKRAFGRVAGAATLGGIGGGLLAERLASAAGVTALLLPLAALGLFCAVTVRRIGGESAAGGGPAEAPRGPMDGASVDRGIRSLFRDRYLRDLALFVVLGTGAATLADYLFKSEAARALSDPAQLLRFFALFYTASGVLTWAVHVTLTRRALETRGVAGTSASLPAVLGASGLGFLAFPGLPAATLLRGTEGVCRNSLFRSSYELLYTPVPRAERRLAKPIVDVGAERVGDALGGALTRLVVMLLPPLLAARALAGVIVAAALAGVLLARRLQSGYVRTLERNLVGGVAPSGNALALGDESLTAIPLLREPPARGPAERRKGELHPEVARLADLLSGDAARVSRALLDDEALPASCVPAAVSLLARDDAARSAIRALRRVVPGMTGYLVDALLAAETDVLARRRIPRILAAAPDGRAVEGLLLGLEDWRFEVRYQCARALARIRQDEPGIELEARRVYAAVIRETAASRASWETGGPLAPASDPAGAGAADRIVRERASRSMEHIFTLLSLVLAREPLQIAYRLLYSREPHLRGTALEYLESVLPRDVRDLLWPHLEDMRRGPKPPARPQAEVLRELARANPSIQIELRELREGRGEPDP